MVSLYDSQIKKRKTIFRIIDRLSGRVHEEKKLAKHLSDAGMNILLKEMYAEAIVNFSCAIRLDPENSEFWLNLATALLESGDVDGSLKCFESGAQCDGPSAHLYSNWGLALSKLGRLHEAIRVTMKAIAIEPENTNILAGLGTIYRYLGRLDDAMMSLDAALLREPASKLIASDRLYTMNFLSDIGVEELALAHKNWPSPAIRPAPRFENRIDPSRKLRIGYVSSDFRRHSCAYFLFPLLMSHDRPQFHITAFSCTALPDEITEKFRETFDQWHDVKLVSDEDLVQMVLAQSIDILVDCSGHTSGNRLSVFASRAAPVQISWLGYPNTTGLAEMDYRLTDDIATPPDMQSLFTETLLPLQSGFHTFDPLYAREDSAPSPCSKNNGQVTFGVFHNLAKISDHALSLWSAILSAVPYSRLIVKSKSFSDPEVQTTFMARCKRHQIETAQLELRQWRAHSEDHFVDLNDIDIALDATPYNGTTTTCEALWMGVPVVTLLGDRPAARVTASLLTQIGREEWIAADNQSYVQIAVDLANKPNQLAETRRALQQQVLDSPLGKADVFAKSVEGAYRAVWIKWCNDQLTQKA